MSDPIPIVLPKAGMKMVEATVVAWHKSPGDLLYVVAQQAWVFFPFSSCIFLAR